VTCRHSCRAKAKPSTVTYLVAGIEDVADPAWVTVILAQTGQRPEVATDGAVVINVRSLNRINVAGAPSHLRLRLIGIGAIDPVERFQVTGLDATEDLEIPDLSAHFLGFPDEGHGLTRLAIGCSRAQTVMINSDALMCHELRLARGSYMLAPGIQFEELSLEDATLNPGTVRRTRRLTLQGSVTLPYSNSLDATATVLATGHADLTVPDSSLPLGSVESMVAGATLGVHGGTVSFVSLPDETTIELDEGVVQPMAGDPIRGLTVDGVGRVDAGAGVEIVGLTLRPSGPGISIDASSADVSEVSGEITRLTARDGRVQGIDDRKNPLQVVAFGDVTSAEIDNFSPYRLSGADISQFREGLGVRRVVPLFASTNNIARSEASMFRNFDPKTRAKKRAHLFAELEDVLASTHSSGRALGDCRMAVMRARRRYLKWGTEKALLLAYGLVGYGERVWRPLVIWGILLVGLALGTSLAGWAPGTSFVPRLGYLFLAPLRALRVQINVPKNGQSPNGLIITAQVTGTVVGIFALLAATRLVRATRWISR
jgi:hypothetical protein